MQCVISVDGATDLLRSLKIRILATGATGAIGPRVVSALKQAGHSVLVLAMDAPTPGLLPDDVEIRLGDITDTAVAFAAMSGIDAVVHLAALLHTVNPPSNLCERYERINVGGTATVVDAAMKAGVRRVVLTSTIGVYGPSDGRVLDEESTAVPDTFYGQTKLAAERIVLAARRADDGRPLGTVLRLAAVYGSRVKGNYSRLVQTLASGRFIPIGRGSNRRAPVYDEDVAVAVQMALDHPRAAGQVFNVTDGEIHTLSRIIEAICAGLGRRPPRIALPAAPIRLGLRVADDLGRAIGRDLPVNSTLLDKYLEDVAVDGTKIMRELGFRPAYDLTAGWRETIRQMRQEGALPHAR